MALNISKGMIDVAIARHPGVANSHPESMGNLDKGHPCSFQINIPFPQERHNVNPDTHAGTDIDANADTRIHTNMNNIDQVTNQISSLVKDCNVCAFLVNWPLSVQGRMGASCGQTMFALDKLTSSSKLFTSARPFAFVNYSRREQLDDEDDTEDQWGRIVNYGRIKDDHPNMIYSSKDAFKLEKCISDTIDEKNEEVKVVGGVDCAWRSLQEFMREQWPDEDLEFHDHFHAGSSSNYHYDDATIFEERDAGTKMYL